MKDYTLTLSGSVQRLSAALSDPTVNGPDDVPCRALHIQPDGTNANPIFVGAAPTVSASQHGVRLAASSGGVPMAPYIFEFSGEGPLRLSHFYVLGTANEKLHLLLLPF